MTTTRFAYFRREKSVLTLCWLVIDKAESRYLVSIGWSLCHKNDKFSKEKGRNIACGRMNKYPINTEVVKPSKWDVANALVSEYEIATDGFDNLIPPLFSNFKRSYNLLRKL